MTGWNRLGRSSVVSQAARTESTGRRKGQAGGSAMHAGARYQNQVTAWLAAKMLVERPAAPIAAESGEAVDDVLAGTDLGSFAFVQTKRRISFSTRDGSDLT